VFEDGAVRVERALKTQGVRGEKQSRHRGRTGFVEALQALARPYHDATDLRFKFKLFRIQKDINSVTTRQYLSLFGRTSEGLLEQNATWIIRWKQGVGDTPPTIEWIGVEDFEQVATGAATGPLFVDVTESVLGHDDSYRPQMLRGFASWLAVIENTQEFAIFGTPGLAVGDVNGDGLDDLYVCQEHGLPNRLYVQQVDGTARDVSESSGVDWLQSCRSALLVDLDNDSDQDLAVATLGNLVLAANDGGGRFTLQAVLPTSDDTMSTTAVDYDNDGDLDLYILGYNPNRRLERSALPAMAAASASFVYHDANNGAPNTLFRNDGSEEDGKWKFTDVTAESGMNWNNRRFSLAAAWEDYDNDGDQDLYVANDYGRDNLYRNETDSTGERRFVDVGDWAQVEDSAGGMGITWGDYNRDGWMDVFVSNMWSSAGNRITYQDAFKRDAPGQVKKRLQDFARGNTLLRNRGDGKFEDVSAPAAIEMGRWAWGSHFVDLNNDGWEDVIVANGYLTGDEASGDL
jgi:hypothetical protein